MQNVTKFPWNDYDRKELKYAEKRCGEIYGESGKCVKLFRKWGERDFSVVCGASK